MKKYRKAVFILAYAKTKKGIEYILLKRKLHWKGWEFPKGGKFFLESGRSAAKRELFEETGMKSVLRGIKKFNFSGKYNYSKSLPDRPEFKGQTFMLYSARVKKPKYKKIKFDNREHSGYKWVNFDEAMKMLKWPNQKKSLKIVDSWINNGK